MHHHGLAAMSAILLAGEMAAKKAKREGRAVYVEDKVEVVEEYDGPVVGKSVKAGRNDPCPCGSGKKHKRCCLTPPQKLPYAG